MNQLNVLEIKEYVNECCRNQVCVDPVKMAVTFACNNDNWSNVVEIWKTCSNVVKSLNYKYDRNTDFYYKANPGLLN